MKTTFKVSYYLRSNYENKEGKSPVMLRIYLGGEKANLDPLKFLWINPSGVTKPAE